eukprot:4372280-Prymnesium_polylepis.1
MRPLLLSLSCGSPASSSSSASNTPDSVGNPTRPPFLALLDQTREKSQLKLEKKTKCFAGIIIEEVKNQRVRAANNGRSKLVFKNGYSPNLNQFYMFEEFQGFANKNKIAEEGGGWQARRGGPQRHRPRSGAWELRPWRPLHRVLVPIGGRI